MAIYNLINTSAKIAVAVMAVAVSVGASANGYHYALKSLPEDEQAVSLGEMAASAGNKQCKTSSPSRPYFQGFDSERAAYWNVTCGSEAFTVRIQNDSRGSNSTMSCGLLAMMDIQCYTKL